MPNFVNLLYFSGNSGCDEYAFKMLSYKALRGSIISSPQDEFMEDISKVAVTFCNQKSMAKHSVAYKSVNEDILTNIVF